MKPEVGRRVFVGSVVAGLPLLAGAGAAAFPQSRGSGVHTHAAGTSVDPVSDHILRQLARIHNTVRSDGVRAEDARAFAAHLRTLAVQTKHTNVDADFRRALRQRIASEGRDAVLYHEPDIAARKKEMKQFGFEIDEQLLAGPQPVDHATRERALDALLAGGVSAAVERTATVLEELADRIDKYRERYGPLQRVRNDAEFYAAYCASLKREITYIASWTAIWCGMSSWAVFLLPSCIAISGGAMVLSVAFLANCTSSMW